LKQSNQPKSNKKYNTKVIKQTTEFNGNNATNTIIFSTVGKNKINQNHRII